ncbi:transmembrane protein 144-like isoform X5 [Scyliorhinus torazame]|uniref:transmembrane protein 144-like isoform X5 n=1 Tax=Scyliorhinus torazame TaxID=75743 RepID=UPI003B5B3B13
MFFSLRWSLVSICVGAVYVIGCDSATHKNSLSNNRILKNGTLEERFTDTKEAIPQNVTGTLPLVKGFVATAIAVICFGSNFVPVKKIDTGDGLFFQWIFCTAIWVVSLVVHLIQQCPQFWPLTMLGGFLWATGNITVIPILKTVGLGMGVLIWATFSLLMGWASSRFGWFGLDVQKVPSPILNYIGTALAALSAGILIFVKTESKEPTAEEKSPLIQDKEMEALQPSSTSSEETSTKQGDACWTDKLNPLQKKLVHGLCFCILQWDYSNQYNLFSHILCSEEKQTKCLFNSNITRPPVGDSKQCVVPGKLFPWCSYHLSSCYCWSCCHLSNMGSVLL